MPESFSALNPLGWFESVDYISHNAKFLAFLGVQPMGRGLLWDGFSFSSFGEILGPCVTLFATMHLFLWSFRSC